MNSVQKQCELYKQGYSSREIADLLNMSRAGVSQNIKKHNLTRKGKGTLVEDRIEAWFRNKYHQVERQKGNAPFDFLINGEKVDIKSANLSCDKTNNISAYWFQLCDITERVDYKDFNLIDYFILVFLDKPQQPIYKIHVSEIKAKTCLRIPRDLSGKYKNKLNLIGFLGGENNE